MRKYFCPCWNLYVQSCAGHENEEKILRLIKTSYRKEKYMEYDIKYCRPDRGKPALETSFEKLCEDGQVFKSNALCPEDVLMNRFSSKWLRECLATLPAQDRLVLMLFYAERMSQQEIADGMGKSQQTVSRYLKAAIKKMKTYKDVNQCE